MSDTKTSVTGWKSNSTVRMEDAGYVMPLSVIDDIENYVTRPVPAHMMARIQENARLPLRTRIWWRIATWRERIGFAIAGYTPSDYD